MPISKLGVLMVVLSTALLTACETSFETDLPTHEPVLVVNGLFAADSTWAVHITKTAPRGHLRTDDPVEDAHIEILRGGQVIERLRPFKQNIGTPHESFSDVYFSPTGRPEEGGTYMLRIAAPGFPPAEAVAFVPQSVPVAVKDVEITWEDGDARLAEISLQFSDPPSVANYYLLKLWEEVTFADSTRQSRTNPRSFRSTDPLLLGDDYDRVLAGEREPYYPRAVFSDRTIDGRTREVLIRTHLNKAREGTTRQAYVQLMSLSEDYYRYLVSRRPLEEDFDLENPFAEPIQLYGNVEGGLGIFAGSSISTAVIESD